MGLFGKKNEREQILENKKTIENNAIELDILISLAKDNVDAVDVLKQVQDKIRYFNPSVNKVVVDYDKKIANKIGDFKILVNKARNSGDYTQLIKDVESFRDSMIEERIAKAKQA